VLNHTPIPEGVDLFAPVTLVLPYWQLTIAARAVQLRDLDAAAHAAIPDAEQAQRVHRAVHETRRALEGALLSVHQREEPVAPAPETVHPHSVGT
jgi:hypothetical protein